jgi:hypothetical protein
MESHAKDSSAEVSDSLGPVYGVRGVKYSYV